MKQHINTIARTWFYHLRRLRQIRRRAGYEVTVRLVLALIMSRVDYCNALFANLPASTITPLQHVQNAAARLVLQLGQRGHISQGLRELHWLPIRAQVLYKLCVLMYDVHSGRSPAHIKDIVTARCSASHWPHSFDHRLRQAMTLWECAFSYTGRHAWNDLPNKLRSTTNTATFKKHLKTHFLNSVFS